MPGGERSIVQRFIDSAVGIIKQRTVARTVSDSFRELDQIDDQVSKFPAVYVTRGPEVRSGLEDSQTVLSILTLRLRVWVHDPTSPERAIERMIQAIDNAMLDDLQKDENAILTTMEDIGEPEFSNDDPNKAAVDMTYSIQYDYVAGNR